MDNTSPTLRPYWPRHMARRFARPETTLYGNLEIAAMRYASAPAIHFFGRTLNYREFKAEADAFAGWLQKRAGVKKGDRVLIYMQNSPQWLVAYYGALRADAVVVPINPMNRTEELKHYLQDSEPAVAVCGQELAQYLSGAQAGDGLPRLVVATYSDYLPQTCEFDLPDWVTDPRRAVDGATPWLETIAANETPGAPLATPDDLCVLPYTSGSTGRPKGCMHTHRTIMHTTAGMSLWHAHAPGSVFLGVAPMYQVSGLMNNVNGFVFAGASVAILPRWNRTLAAQLIERYRVNYAAMAPTAIIDFLAASDLDRYDLSSLRRIGAGGASMPDEVWKRLNDRLGLPFIEAYGMTETAATIHVNPVDRPKRRCLGVAFFETEALVVDVDTLEPLGPMQPGEILARGPQVFQGYWKKPEATEAAFAEIGGERFYRTGDIGYYDEEGYFFITDRLKRMINAAGFKVWPAEVENALYEHPDILEACVIGLRDAYRGETVKALVVLKPERRGQVREADVVDWARQRMAAYKYPRLVEFVDALPKSPVGKILWKQLQDQANAAQNREQPQ